MATKKETYQQKLEAQLDEVEARLNLWRAKMEQAGADAKLEYQRQLENVEKQRDTARNRLQELRDASEDAWEEMKAGVDRAWNELQSAFENAADHFRKLESRKQR